MFFSFLIIFLKQVYIAFSFTLTLCAGHCDYWFMKKKRDGEINSESRFLKQAAGQMVFFSEILTTKQKNRFGECCIWLDGMFGFEHFYLTMSMKHLKENISQVIDDAGLYLLQEVQA